ncbi:MAG TPA: RNA polymerase sigma factor RpoD/SigA [Terriglobales bacterium]|nr:RNA polymerase sigma factor RpoD/SigA [Terriglobales bacterium]
MSPQDFLDSKNLKHYLEEIGKFPALTEEQEKRLGERIRQGDKAALQELIQANLKFVVSYVKKYRGMGLSMLDLIDEGNVGLIEAAKRFDPTRNVRFISYAVWWIRQAIIHALSQYSHIFNIPQKLSDQISMMKKRRAALKTELGREPTRDEVAKTMGIPEEDIEDLELLEERNVSLSDKCYDDDLEVEDRVSDGEAESVEYQIIKASAQHQIREMLSVLDEKEALVIKLRFGLDDDRPMTLQEIGDRLHLTRERIRQIEQKAMRKLGRSKKLQQLRGYLN